jgi:hypothetical protein
MRDDFRLNRPCRHCERNEVERSNPDFQRTSWIASSLLLLAMTDPSKASQ